MKKENIRKCGYSDLAVIRVGEDYFMIASGFCNVPVVSLAAFKGPGELESGKLYYGQAAV